MSTIASWTILNNEIDFLPDILEHHLPWLDFMYFLDTGSTDGSLEFLRLQAENNPKIIVQEYHTKFTPQYDKKWEEMSNPFPEVEVRNYALEQVEKLGCEWLIQLDGDEVFLSSTREIIERNLQYSIFGHSTINPVEELKKHPIERRHGNILYDPHARIWKSNLKIRYQNNPAFKSKQYHCIPILNGKHIYHSPKIKFFSELIHFHLHWLYGKKVERFYSSLSPLEIAQKQTNPDYWKDKLPEFIYKQRESWLLHDLQTQIIKYPFEKTINKKLTSELIEHLLSDIVKQMMRLAQKGLIFIPESLYPILEISNENQGTMTLSFQYNEKKISGESGLKILLENRVVALTQSVAELAS